MGSGNVSQPGLTHNQEVWTRFAYTKSAPDDSARAAFRWAFDYLAKLAQEQQDPMLQRRLDQLWQTIGWLRQDPAPLDNGGHWLFHNLDYPIMDQLVDQWAQHDGSPVREAVVISPYFDRRSLAFEALLGALRPERISLITEPEDEGAGYITDRGFTLRWDTRARQTTRGVQWQEKALPRSENRSIKPT